MKNTQMKHTLKMFGLGFLIAAAIVDGMKLLHAFPVLIVILPALTSVAK